MNTPLAPVAPNSEETLALFEQESQACWDSVLQALFGPAGPALTARDEIAAPEDRLWFSCDFAPAQLGSVWFGIDRDLALEFGSLLLIAKGRASAHEHHVLYGTSHVLGQFAAALASILSRRLNIAISITDCATTEKPPSSARPLQLSFVSSLSRRALTVSLSSDLVAAIANPLPLSGPPARGAATQRNLDLLLDLEMPVCISFGSTRIALKDVARLNTGSIVELNRALSEPVDVVVNNCAIARGEVVVVDGNFAVRISEVMSKQDRLRSLS
ncbi:MAG: flagellar motor switch protein FliN [Acidobacteriaceae bacterium]|nr:flagellar motor switch protein FliN [Acidobacteriaceae bacterium]